MSACPAYGILAFRTFAKRLHHPVCGRVSRIHWTTDAAALALIIAGAAAATWLAAPVGRGGHALVAMVLGDLLLFFIGRYTGWSLLGLLCRLSLNPESCVLRPPPIRSTGAGVFCWSSRSIIPGNQRRVAPPLAGSMNMRFAQFFGLDCAGARPIRRRLPGRGNIFSGAIGALVSGYHAAGRLLSWILIAAVVGTWDIRRGCGGKPARCLQCLW